MAARFTRRAALAAVFSLAACRRRPKPGSAEGAAKGDAGIADGSVGDAARDAEAAFDGGALYRATTGSFQVRFPEGKAPEVEHKPITGGLSVSMFKVQYGTSGYIVTFDDFNRTSGRSAEQILDGAKEGVLETTGGTLDKEDPLTLEGHPGIELSVSATTSGIAMRQRVRVYLVDGRVYQLIVVAPTWSGASASEQEFFDSFKLLRDGG